MAVPLLRQLLAILKALILGGKRLLKETWVRLLRKVAFLWSILRSGLRNRTHQTNDGKKGPEPRHRPIITPKAHDSSDKPVHDTTITNSTTITTTNDGTIPFDSNISCSLHPYPYINHNMDTPSSLNLGLQAARSAHSVAVHSRNASRSTHYLGSPSSGAQSFQEDYTFIVKTPDHPISPITRRQYSLSSPQLGSGSGRDSGHANPGYPWGGPEVINRTESSSPADSTLELPAVQEPSIHDNVTQDAHSEHRISSPLRIGYTLEDLEIVQRTHSSSPAESPAVVPIGLASSPHGSVAEIVHRGSDHDINLAHDRIFPIVPEYFQRYDRTAFAEARETKLIIKSLTMDYRESADPPGWKSIMHPEGVLYFYNKEKSTVTEANLFDPLYYNQITEDIATIEDFMRANGIRPPPNYTLAMDLNMRPHGEIYTDYYFADHDRKTIFFLDEIEASVNFPVWREVKGVTSLAHIRHEVEAQYWHHGMLYPSTVELTAENVAELRDIILHYIGDSTTSQYSTSPYHLPDLNTMLSQVNSLKKNVGHQYIGSTSLLSRMMFVFTRQRFYNWHGLPEARLYRDQSVHGKPRKRRTWLIRSLSPLLFSAPDTHLKNLEKMWVDGIMHGAVWTTSINKLNDEWQEFILYATVLLNANVAFLAIQSIDTHENSYRSPTQISSYLSTVASIGSIVLGLLLMRQTRTRAHGTTADVNAFLKARSHPTLGLETLAILYSLPYALLLWGMVSFLAAFAWNCFDHSNIATRTIMGSAWVAFTVLVLWCIWMGWVNHEASDTPNVDSSSGAANPETGSTHSHKSEGGHSAKSGSSSRHSRRSGGGAAAVKKNPGFSWSWPAFLFHTRRESYDSQRTVVQKV